MKSAPTSCGFDPAQFRELKEQLKAGLVTAVFHKPTGRVLYLEPAELAALPEADYVPVRSGPPAP